MSLLARRPSQLAALCEAQLWPAEDTGEINVWPLGLVKRRPVRSLLAAGGADCQVAASWLLLLGRWQGARTQAGGGSSWLA